MKSWIKNLGACLSVIIAGVMALSGAEMRTWTNTKGKTIRAEFVKLEKVTPQYPSKN